MEPTTRLHQLQRRVYASSHQLSSHLLSIVCDSAIVNEVRDFLSNSGMSMVANLRNGLWYADSFEGTCYFKSTDGHVRNWSFASSRLNLETACRAFTDQGIVIVDSTKAGKRYPDSMTYTIPIWCAVINCLLYKSVYKIDLIDRSIVEQFTSLAPWIPPSYQQQLHHKILDIVTNLPHAICNIIVQQVLPSYLQCTPQATNDFCALRMIWVSPDEDGCIDWQGKYAESLTDHIQNLSTTTKAGNDLGYIPIIALSCSGIRNSTASISSLSPLGMSHSSVHSWTYIAGAGDDDEYWSHGLTPALFWKHREYILTDYGDEDVENRMQQILQQEQKKNDYETCMNNNSTLTSESMADTTVVTSTLHLVVLTDEEWMLLSQHSSVSIDGEMENGHNRFIRVHICEGKASNNAEKDSEEDGLKVFTLHVHPFKKDRSHHDSEWTDVLLPSLLPYIAGPGSVYICIRSSDGAMGKEVGGLLILSVLLHYYSVDTGEGRFVLNGDGEGHLNGDEKETDKASSVVIRKMTKEEVRVYVTVLQTILPWFYPQRRLLKLVMAHFLPAHQL